MSANDKHQQAATLDLTRFKRHTPGPWEHGKNPKWKVNAPWSISRQLVVRPRGEFPHGAWVADCGMADNRVQRANARLIAAAPTLLAECAALRSLLTRAATGLAHLAHCRDCGEGNPRDCAHGRDALTALEDAMKHLHQTQAAATPTATDKEMNR